MKAETVQLAKELFTPLMTTAQNLQVFSEQERAELFKFAVEMCFEAAIAFEKFVENAKEHSDDL